MLYCSSIYYKHPPAPTLARCDSRRKAVLASEGKLVETRGKKSFTPYNATMTYNRLARNARGKVVSKKKSIQSKKRYYDDPPPAIRVINELAKQRWAPPSSPLSSPLSQGSYDDDGFDDGYDAFEEEGYVPFQAQAATPLPAKRPRKPLEPGALTYKMRGTGPRRR